MNEQEIQKVSRKVAQQVYMEMQTQGQFSPIKIPLHTHNGVDNNKINLVNTIPNNKFVIGFTSSAGGGNATIEAGISNPTSIQLFGIALDGLGARASIVGNAQLGQGFITNGTYTYPSESGVIQACSSIYNSAATTRVATAPYIGYVVDDLGIVKATITVISFTSTSITISSVLATNWTFTCNLIIT